MSALNNQEEVDVFGEPVEVEIDGEKDPFEETYNPFDEEPVEQVTEEEETEDIDETEEEEKPVIKKQSTPKEKKQPEDTSLKIEAGVAILKYLAEVKGIGEEIDFDSIKDEDDMADLVEAFKEYDEVSAIERIKSSNKDLKKVIEFIEAGVDTSKIGKLLTEQEEVLELNTSTEDGAKTLLRKYYKNVLGFDDDVIDKRIKKFSDNGQLQEEAEDIKPLYDKDLEKRQQKVMDESQKQLEKEKVLLKQRQQDFIKLLNDNKVSKSVAQNYWQVAFGQRELEDGTRIGELDYKFQVMQRDPQQYLKLVEFVANPDLYDKRVLQNKNTTLVKEQHTKRINFNNNKPTDTQEGVRTQKPKFKF